MKKQMAVALGLLVLVPITLMLGGWLFSLINPEIAAGHANYERNFRLLTLLKNLLLMASGAVVVILWLLACFFVIRSKGRSLLWLSFAALGPLGFAILMMLKDNDAAREMDHYSRFVRSLNVLVRIAYEVCLFVVLWLVAYQAMVLKRNLMIMYQSYATGLSTQQILDQQNASSGMWAFSEALEVIYLVVLFYLLWPILFNIVAHLAANKPSLKAG